MNEQGTHDEIHALHVVNLFLVVREGGQYSFESLGTFARLLVLILLEERVARECST